MYSPSDPTQAALNSDPSLLSKLDPITLQSMMQIFPQLQQLKRKGDRLREAQQQAKALMNTHGQNPSGVRPTQRGSWYETVAQYRPDYTGAANKITGALGDYLAGKQADEADQQYSDMQGGQIIQTLDQMGNNAKPGASQAGPSNSTLRGYLGLIGGSDVLGKIPHVSSTRVDEQGNVFAVMSDGTEMPTGRKADYKGQVIKDEGTGEIRMVGTSGAGRGVVSPVTGGAGSAAPAPASSSPMGPVKVNFDWMTPDQNEQLARTVSMLPQDQGEQILASIAAQHDAGKNSIKPGSVQVEGAPAGLAPPPGQQGTFRVTPKADLEAGVAQAKTTAEINAKNALASQTAAAEAQIGSAKAGATADAETAAKARNSLPQVETTLADIKRVAGALLTNPNLNQIIGPSVLGRMPDNAINSSFGQGLLASSKANDAFQLHQQLVGKLFQAAYDSLRGAGQITEAEERGMKPALANLRRSQSPEQFKQAVRDFVNFMQTKHDALKAQADGRYSAPMPSVAPAATAAPVSIQDLLNKYRKH